MGFKEFCGGAPLWDQDVSWYTKWPDLTPCFHATILSWVPLMLLLITTPFEISSWRSSRSPSIPLNILNVSKLAITLALVGCCVTELFFLEVSTSLVADAEYVGSSVEIIAYMYSALLLVCSLRNGVVTSGPQFLFWLLDTVCKAVVCRSTVRDYNLNKVDQNRFILSIAFLTGSSVALIIQVFADKTTNAEFLAARKPCPQYNSSFVNKLTYSWITHLIWTGFRRPLTTNELWDIVPSISSKEVVPQFKKIFKTAKEKNSNKIKNTAIKSSSHNGPDNSKNEEANLKKPIVSVLPSLWRSYGSTFAFGACLELIICILMITSPLILKQMIIFVEKSNDPNKPPDDMWKGYFYGILLFVALTCKSLLESQYLEIMLIISIKVRTVLVSELYRKSLIISSTAKKESTVGEIVNLMAVDVQRFMVVVPYLNMIWSCLLQIGLPTYFIYLELGWAAFVGVAILFLSLPANAIVATKMRNFTVQQMKEKDMRIKMMNEILSGMKVLKLYAWEPSFINLVLSIRSKEIKVMKKTAYLQAFLAFFWMTSPFLVGLGSFATYIFMNGGQVLTAQKAFVTIAFLDIMKRPLTMLPVLVTYLVQSKVSLDRVNKFLNNEELDQGAVSRDSEQEDAISIKNGNFQWAADEPNTLQDININIPHGSLTAVVGTVGCGKSSLISAMLGELYSDNGEVAMSPGKIGYVPQLAWIQNSTLRENILFCQPDISDKYEDAVSACALRTDFDILPAGDQTEIGEKGINLSGGQKQRVSLARAVYSEADIYLLDDPLSAVDSHVGKHIFEEVIGPNGRLKDTTRILVTHGITFLPKTDHIIVMKKGRISEQGSFKELLSRKGEFAAFLLEHMEEQDDSEEEDIKQELERTLGQEVVQQQMNRQKTNRMEELDIKEKVENINIEINKVVTKAELETKDTVLNDGTTLIEIESTETGSVKFSVYMYYIKTVGIIGTIAILILQVLEAATGVMVNYWLTWWTENKYGNASESKYRDMYLGVYGAIGLANGVLLMVFSALFYISTLNASKWLHKKMLTRVMMSPMSFFDTTPLGRIVNRFSQDVDVCDNILPTSIWQWLSQLSVFLSTIVVILTVIPYFIIVIVPIIVIFVVIQRLYVSTSRQLKRLESVTRSPIYSQFEESITGSQVIRAFGRMTEFIKQSEELVDANQVCFFPSIIANRWLAIRLELLGNIVTLGAAMFVMVNPSALSPSEAGLVIKYSLVVTQILSWLVRITAEVETNVVAVERIMEYSNVEQEAPWIFPDDRSDKDWPQSGMVKIQNFGLRYRKGLDLVLQGITASITGGQKVGIVGRTGAGKSTLTVALFRLVEAAEGSITIDGMDISQLGLHDLRNKLTIIPQDPVLFSGSIRMNLDPFSSFGDQQLWTVLEQAHLKNYVTGLENGLEHKVIEGGNNLSVGQRQLVCLARAILRKTKVLVLDEATASVDLKTDHLIQTTIRKEFADCTVLTIAHRLNTIMDSDQIMVLDKGRLAEFDTPSNLLADPNSIFSGMAKDAGISDIRDNNEI